MREASNFLGLIITIRRMQSVIFNCFLFLLMKSKTDFDRRLYLSRLKNEGKIDFPREFIRKISNNKIQL